MLQAVADTLRHRGIAGWLVGGSVRDLELGRDSPDLDVVVAGDAAAVAKDVAAALHAPWFILSERHLAYRVMGQEGHIDVAAARGDILNDLAERDFTINAMALPIGDYSQRPGALIDPFGGLRHLEERRLVAVSERVFAHDALRLMRAARFTHVLGLSIDEALARSIRDQAGELGDAAAERIVAEMVVTLTAGRSADAARLWHDLGLLGAVLPEVECLDRLQPTLRLLEAVDDVLEHPAVWFPATADALAPHLANPVDGAISRPVALRLAGLTHQLREQEAANVGGRLKLSREMSALLRIVSRYLPDKHSFPSRGKGHRLAPPSDGMPTRAEVLFFWDAAPYEPEMILLAAATGQTTALPGSARRMMALWAERSYGLLPKCPVDGELLMQELGLESGPLVGKALREVRLAWETGEASARPELLDVARRALAVD